MINAFVFLIIELIIDRLSRIKLYTNSYYLGIANSSVLMLPWQSDLEPDWGLLYPLIIKTLCGTEELKGARGPQRTPLCLIAAGHSATFRATGCSGRFCEPIRNTHPLNSVFSWSPPTIAAAGGCGSVCVVSCGFYRLFETDLKNVIVCRVFSLRL